MPGSQRLRQQARGKGRGRQDLPESTENFTWQRLDESRRVSTVAPRSIEPLQRLPSHVQARRPSGTDLPHRMS